jgi:hypothetical protein
MMCIWKFLFDRYCQNLEHWHKISRRLRGNVMRPSLEFVKNRCHGDIVGVEVGVFEGVNAEEILNQMKPKMLYLVDPWCPYIQDGQGQPSVPFNTVVARFSGRENVTLVRDSSLHAATSFSDGTCDFVYIDGNHEYQEVRADIFAWWPKVKKDGVLCGHDYVHVWKGVIQAVDEFVLWAELNQDYGNKGLSIKESDWWVVK